MNIKKVLLGAAALLIAAPMFGSTYFGGYEDTTRHSDWDYNDIVFSLSGTGLTLHTSDGKFYTNPTLGTSGNPFWNNASGDGSKMNIGYCIYGGGNCNGGVPLDANAPYLASKSGASQSADDVYFTVDGNVSTDIVLKISSLNSVLGWYDMHGHFGIINPGGATGDFSFHPTGDFGLFGTNITGYKNGQAQYGTYYYSQVEDCSDPSHFAFFATPEPGTMGVMGLGLLAVGSLFRRRKNSSPESRD